MRPDHAQPIQSTDKVAAQASKPRGRQSLLVLLLWLVWAIVLAACSSGVPLPTSATPTNATVPNDLDTTDLPNPEVDDGGQPIATAPAELRTVDVCASMPTPTTMPRTGESAAATGAVDTMITYADQTNTITIEKGATVTLPTLNKALNQPALLREVAAGEWLLAANLRLNEGSSLTIGGAGVQRLRLKSDDQGFVWIKSFGGQLTFQQVCVTSWDSARNGYDLNAQRGRSFVLARDGARMNIYDSVLSFLGYAANESYGVAWRLKGTSGEVLNSNFGYNFYGMYTFEASDLVIRGNEVHHSVRYGIDPHTGSNRLLIEQNIAHHNGKQGIILAEECSNSIIRNNTVYSNTMHGIVIYQRSNNNRIEGNTVYGNGYQGININDADGNTIQNNTVYENVKDGIGVDHGSKQNTIADNTVYDNQQDGIALVSEATSNTLRANEVRNNKRYGIYIKSSGNQVEGGNRVFGNQIGVYLNVDNADPASVQNNDIHDNAEDNLRIKGTK